MDLILANRALVDHHAPPGGAGGPAPATGGLVEAVRPVLVPWDGATGTTWIGAGRGPHDRAWTDPDGFELLETPVGPIRHQRLYVAEDDWRGHYAEVANGFFWPLLHLVRVDLPLKLAYYPTPEPPSEAAWAAYERVNRAFAKAALAARGEVCWVHDYQLALVPAMLREGGFAGRTGFFLHTPFPSLAVAESSLPPPARARFAAWLDGILGADLAGVQTEADADRLREAAERLCGARVEGPDLRLNGRIVRIAAFPAGIDADDLARQAPAGALPATVPHDPVLPLVVGLERADYTKGVPERLAAITAALQGGARFAYAGFSAPTRPGVPAYDALQAECERLGAEASALAADRGLPFVQSREALAWSEVLALLREADVVFTASIADGMNLVPLQAVIAQSSRPAGGRGVVLAGRDAGVSSAYAGFEDDGLVALDPLNADASRCAFLDALEGRPGCVSDRLVAAVREHDAHAWGRTFLGALDGA
ncbi:MAG: trehalose-6-phosphate synthase [Chloroflexota bacterium]|nr:trehalose-6-phosphate synthase [Chloroflexota bacterium]